MFKDALELEPKTQIETQFPTIGVSVIIPSLNRKSELLRAINSVLNQTFKVLEIIIIDDCSDFSNHEYLKANGLGLDSIKVFRNFTNRGTSYSRNLGISKAKGELIAFLDSDDFWNPEKIAKQVQFFKKNPNVDMVYCDTYLFINGEKIVCNTLFYDNELWSHLISGWKPTNPSTLILKKRSFSIIGYFDEKLRHHEDFDFWLRAADSLKIGYCHELLSNFSFDAEDRLSNEYQLKFKGTDVFLKKWKDIIISREGLEVYSRFKKELVFRMAIETFNCAFKFKKYQNLFGVFFNHLIFNKRFYTLLLRKFKNFQIIE